MEVGTSGGRPVRHAQFAELRLLLIAQDAALTVIALVLVIGLIAVIMAAGDRPHRDVRDTQAGKPQTRRRTM